MNKEMRVFIRNAVYGKLEELQLTDVNRFLVAGKVSAEITIGYPHFNSLSPEMLKKLARRITLEFV